ncbi:MAG TPA: ferrochelatase [Oceanospirillaceae bacterium]|nr:ferrochelatase [Oceanospirillaceae bacterium]
MAKIGVLLVNLGSPNAPTAEALKPYLKEFLSDRRVVDLPALLWQPILRGIILRKRPARSAALYAKIWLDAGSPLTVYSTSIQSKLQAWADSQSLEWQVELGMTYGDPSMQGAMAKLQEQGVDKLVVLPLFPQYSTTTTAAVYDAYERASKQLGYAPELLAIQDYYAQEQHISALAKQVETYWQQHGRAEQLVMSFHGTPQATRAKGDPYYDQCLVTGKALADKLGLADDAYRIAFQSRFGYQEWLQPYAEPMLEDMAKQGVASVQVICPGFAVDCLETLEEVALGFEEAFKAAGGKEFAYMPCLNDADGQVEALAALVNSQLAEG